jgi:hypothetical protein
MILGGITDAVYLVKQHQLSNTTCLSHPRHHSSYLEMVNQQRVLLAGSTSVQIAWNIISDWRQCIRRRRETTSCLCYPIQHRRLGKVVIMILIARTLEVK